MSEAEDRTQDELVSLQKGMNWSQADPSQVPPHVLNEVIHPHEQPAMKQEYTSQHRHSEHNITKSHLEHRILVYRDEERTDSAPTECIIRRQLSMLFKEEPSPDLIIRHCDSDAADRRRLTVLVYDAELAAIAGEYGVFGAMAKGGKNTSRKKKSRLVWRGINRTTSPENLS